MLALSAMLQGIVSLSRWVQVAGLGSGVTCYIYWLCCLCSCLTFIKLAGTAG